MLPGVERMVGEGYVTGAADRNREFLGEALTFAESVPEWRRQVLLDPQTSGGLALFSKTAIPGAIRIGRVVVGQAAIRVR